MNNFRWLGIALAMLVAGCASVPIPESLKAAHYSGTEDAYRIGVDDRVAISVWRNPELSVTVPVRPDGMISVPIIGDVRAGGLTPTEVANAITKRLSAYVREPSVAVMRSGMTKIASGCWVLSAASGYTTARIATPHRPSISGLTAPRAVRRIVVGTR